LALVFHSTVVTLFQYFVLLTFFDLKSHLLSVLHMATMFRKCIYGTMLWWFEGGIVWIVRRVFMHSVGIQI